MSFLAPWFVLAGIAAVSLPVLFHLLRRTPRGKMPFSSLMFLTPSPPRLTRRSRLDHWPLLLLRGLILTLLALAFGRPFLRQLLEQQQDAPVGERVVVLVDTSASMQRGELFKQALAKTEQIAAGAGVHDDVALVAFGNTTRPLVSFEAWRAAPTDERAGLARAALAELKPTWSATRLDQALIGAVELLDAADRDKTSAASERRRRVIVVSDMQQGSRLTGLQSFEWPKRVEVQLLTLTSSASNAGVHPLAASDEATELNAAANRPRVLVTNAAQSQRESFELAWHVDPTKVAASAKDEPDESAKPVSIYVPPGQTRVVRTPPVPAGDVAQLTLRGDDEPFDNTLWFVPPTREQVRVLHLSSEPSDDPQTLRYFLERALGSGLAGRVITVESVDPHGDGVRTPTERYLDAVPLVVVALDKDLPQPWLAVLGTWLQRGGVALGVVNKPDVAPWRGLLPAALAEPDAIKVQASDDAREYALLSELDLRHPWLTPLNDPRFSDFTKIRFWKHRQLRLSESAAKQCRVVARFDSGDPAWLEAPRGAGRVVLMTSGWQPRESQLGVSSKFVPLMATLVDLGWRKPPPTVSYESGTIIDLTRLGEIPEDGVSTPQPSPLVGEGGERSSPGEGAQRDKTSPRSKDPSKDKSGSTSPVGTPSPPAPLPQGERGDNEKPQPAKNLGPWTIKTPGGREVAVTAESPRFEPDEGPGVYEVRSSSGLQRLAIHIPADETKTAPLGPEALETLGVRLVKEQLTAPPLTAAEKQTLQSRELESRQQLWRWCLFAALGMVIGETWYAGRVARRERE